MEYLRHVLDTISESVAAFCFMCAVKIPLAIGIGVTGYLFGVHNKQALIALIVIVSIDFLTGVYGSYSIGQPIESRRAVKTAIKTTFYFLFVSAAYLTETIIPGTTFLDEATISFLAITELISIMENIGKMGYEVPLKLLGKLKGLRKEL